MRDEEAFVARSLLAFLGQASGATVTDGGDPPDFVLHFENCGIGVEVTRLSQFAVRSDGTLGSRLTEDSFALRLLDDLDSSLGALLPDGTALSVGLQMPVQKADRFRKQLAAWIREIAPIAKPGAHWNHAIGDVVVRVVAIREGTSGTKIAGWVSNANASADIGLNARLLLEDRITAKNETCAHLPRPLWLALLNDYWLADEDSYAVAYDQLHLEHCFKRIFLVADNGCVSELTDGT